MSKHKESKPNPEVMTSEYTLQESGLPGSGKGRREEVGHSGVYRVSDPDAPGDAVVRPLPSWGQGKRGAAGYFDHGEGGVLYVPAEANDATLGTGKPGVLKCRERLEAYLKENGVAYQLHHHPKAFTAEEVANLEHLPGQKMAKVVLVIAEDKMIMLVLSACEVVDLYHIAEMLGVDVVRLAREEEFAPVFLDCEMGAMPPFGNLYDLPVYLDTKLAEQPTIAFQAGTSTETIELKFADFDRLVRPVIVTFRWEIN